LKRWLWIALAASCLATGCDKHAPKKPDPTKGSVTGVVICADTGKPARFAKVVLSLAPRKNEKIEDSSPLPTTETAVTDMDGRFDIEAVEPGRYYAYATQEGYLDPERGLDFDLIKGLDNDHQRHVDAIAQWRDHLTELRAAAHHPVELSLTMERAAEIGGRVSFDDGSPAIGMHFQLFRKTEKAEWSEVGLALFDGFSTRETSDGHGRFNLTNLPAGEYSVCALTPAESEATALRICLGNAFRVKDAKSVKVQAGETATGVEIVVPLTGLHTVAGNVTALPDGHPVVKGTVRLLWADDREFVREFALQEDGSFSFAYVPEGSYILQVTGAGDAPPEQKDAEPAAAPAADTAGKIQRVYPDREIPVTVVGDQTELQVQLQEVTRTTAAK
jgi:hypothetical protein